MPVDVEKVRQLRNAQARRLDRWSYAMLAVLLMTALFSSSGGVSVVVVGAILAAVVLWRLAWIRAEIFYYDTRVLLPANLPDSGALEPEGRRDLPPG